MCQRALYCYISAKYIRWPVWHRSWYLMKSYLAAPYTIKPLILNRNQRESKRPAENLRLASLGISPRSVYLIPSWGVGSMMMASQWLYDTQCRSVGVGEMEMWTRHLLVFLFTLPWVVAYLIRSHSLPTFGCRSASPLDFQLDVYLCIYL
jgi:hypothetical protein